MRFLRFTSVRERTGLSRSTIWRLERQGGFPKHRRISAKRSRVARAGVNEWVLELFLQKLFRVGDLLRALPGWTVRALLPQQIAGVMSRFEEAARYELTAPLRSDNLAELKWYFKKRRSAVDPRALSLEDEEFWHDQAAFDTPRFRQLYRRWLSDGDSVFETVSSPAIAEALERGTGRIESHVLMLSYRHLGPVTSFVRSVEGGRGGGTMVRTPSTPFDSIVPDV